MRSSLLWDCSASVEVCVLLSWKSFSLQIEKWIQIQIQSMLRQNCPCPLWTISCIDWLQHIAKESWSNSTLHSGLVKKKGKKPETAMRSPPRRLRFHTCLFVCSLVCSFVSTITQTQLYGLPWHLVENVLWVRKEPIQCCCDFYRGDRCRNLISLSFTFRERTFYFYFTDFPQNQAYSGNWLHWVSGIWGWGMLSIEFLVSPSAVSPSSTFQSLRPSTRELPHDSD